MPRRLLLICLFLLGACVAPAKEPAFDQSPHDYWQRPLGDRFTKLKEDIEAGRLVLDGSGGEKAFLLNLLRTLDVPATSQMLVFSTTSLQLRLITPANPRALFFNEDVYVGYIPGGRIEIVSLDPALGGIFYIFDIPRGAESIRPERSNRCMNCHAAEDTGNVPALVIKSVIPGIRGGSLDSYRHGETGHGVPFAERFGGWYLTGAQNFAPHLANVMGQLSPEGLTKYPLEPGTRFDYARYPVATSDVLPQLLHEHQIGFVNRAITATYHTRALLEKGSLDDAAITELNAQAREFTRYLLFADEVPLPPGGVRGEPAFKADFGRTRHADPQGAALKDFDLQTRLFRYRCSYMIYGAAFSGLPPEFKQRVYRRLGEALDVARPDAEYAYLPPVEKQVVRGILRATLPDLPAGW
ncbi:MAG: hypothetical protein ABJF10_01830 [Chthoniobacter sp.]|uniref:hypothetical protein n=1 Tax=Chthoniobacter sp. TaxID=2510640 RepID=UPI0032A8F612